MPAPSLSTHDAVTPTSVDSTFAFEELVANVRGSFTIDWQHPESARARIRVLVRRILRKHGYPPDLQEKATRLVLEQAEALCRDWANSSDAGEQY